MNNFGIDPNETYITNTTKCRPPQNRLPKSNETNTCMSILLLPQIDIIKPKIIVTVGNHATKNLKSIFEGESNYNFQIIPLHHPAYVIRTPKALKKFQETLKKIASEANK
jgi:DNA polymerase